MQKPAKATLGQLRTDLSPSRKGDIAELYVCLISQWKGAEVLRNVGCDGKADIVLIINDKPVQIDVKLAQWKRGKPGYYYWSTKQASEVKLPVYPVLVIPDGDIMDWKIRWKNARRGTNPPPHCPPGLENYWSKPSTNV